MRAGQLAADTEFMTGNTRKCLELLARLASRDFPNLPSGGPSPPLAAVGVRLRADITVNLTVLGAIFNGDSAGPDSTTRSFGPARRQLRINDPPLARRDAVSLERRKKRTGSRRDVRVGSGNTKFVLGPPIRKADELIPAVSDPK